MKWIAFANYQSPDGGWIEYATRISHDINRVYSELDESYPGRHDHTIRSIPEFDHERLMGDEHLTIDIYN